MTDATPPTPPSPQPPNPAPSPAPPAPSPTQPLYEYGGPEASTIDIYIWPKAPFQSSDGNQLYYFRNDEPDSGQNGQAHGANPPEWVPYAGAVVPI